MVAVAMVVASITVQHNLDLTNSAAACVPPPARLSARRPVAEVLRAD